MIHIYPFMRFNTLNNLIGDWSIIIIALTELAMASDAQQNGRKAHYVKHCKCA